MEENILKILVALICGLPLYTMFHAWHMKDNEEREEREKDKPK